MLGCPFELPEAAPGPRLARWTVLVHMAADTDPSREDSLAPYLEGDLAELRQGAAQAGDRVHIVVQVDRPGAGGYAREALGEHVYDPVDESVPGAAALKDFLRWGASTFPASHYAVVVWGHGKGWRNAGASGEAPFTLEACGGGIAFDDAPLGAIDTPALADALGAVAEVTGRRVDVYAADACLMQTAEVATELAGAARFVVGSEQIGSYLGLPYRELVDALAQPQQHPAQAGVCAPDDDACRVAWTIPQQVAAAFAPEGRHARARPDDAETFTSAAVRTAGLDALRVTLVRLGARIDAWRRAKPIRAVDLRQLLDDCSTPDFLCGARDLGVFLTHLQGFVARDTAADASTGPLLEAIAAAGEALDDVVVHARFGPRYVERCEVGPACPRVPCHRGRRGLSIWLPRDRQEWDERAEDYAGSPLAAWDDWLDGLP